MDPNKKKDHDPVEGIIHCVIDSIEHHVKNSASALEETIRSEANHINDTVEKGLSDQRNDTINLIASHNAVIGHVMFCSDTTKCMKEEVVDNMQAVVDQSQQVQAKADHFENMSYRLRGALGAQERKRRKIDLDQISRLRNENSDLKRQLQAKNAECQRKDDMLGDLADRVEEVLCEIDESKHQAEELRSEIKEIRSDSQELRSEVKKIRSDTQELRNEMKKTQSDTQKILQLLTSRQA